MLRVQRSVLSSVILSVGLAAGLTGCGGTAPKITKTQAEKRAQNAAYVALHQFRERARFAGARCQLVSGGRWYCVWTIKDVYGGGNAQAVVCEPAIRAKLHLHPKITTTAGPTFPHHYWPPPSNACRTGYY